MVLQVMRYRIKKTNIPDYQEVSVYVFGISMRENENVY